MSSLYGRDLLQLWERGEQLHPIDRALSLLVAAYPERSWDELTGLSIGQRDALLLRLRERIFGPTLDFFTTCPNCGERLESSLRVTDVLDAGASDSQAQEYSLSVEGYNVTFRLPDSTDLAAIANLGDVEEARSLLLSRCILEAQKGNTAIEALAMPKSVMAAIGTAMDNQDPSAQLQIQLSCPECHHQWATILDIISFLWSEISAYIRRLMQEIHILARSYGWSEADILGMSDRRRQTYLELVA